MLLFQIRTCKIALLYVRRNQIEVRIKHANLWNTKLFSEFLSNSWYRYIAKTSYPSTLLNLYMRFDDGGLKSIYSAITHKFTYFHDDNKNITHSLKWSPRSVRFLISYHFWFAFIHLLSCCISRYFNKELIENEEIQRSLEFRF